MRYAALDEPEPLLRSFRQVRVDRQDHVLAVDQQLGEGARGNGWGDAS